MGSTDSLSASGAEAGAGAGAGAGAAGFYGKLPGAGDFVQRRLPASFVETWDAAFESAVAGSRAQLGEATWVAAYRACPPWRFVLAPGICGAAAWAGVLGPGVDRVGRCFPLVIARELAAGAVPASVFADGAAWFAAAAQLLTGTLGAADSIRGGTAPNAETFAAAVSALPAPGLAGRGAGATGELPALRPGTHWHAEPPGFDALAAGWVAALWNRHAAAMPNACLWWTTNGAQGDADRDGRARLIATAGLPQAEAFAALLAAGDDRGGVSRVAASPAAFGAGTAAPRHANAPASDAIPFTVGGASAAERGRAVPPSAMTATTDHHDAFDALLEGLGPAPQATSHPVSTTPSASFPSTGFANVATHAAAVPATSGTSLDDLLGDLGVLPSSSGRNVASSPTMTPAQATTATFSSATTQPDDSAAQGHSADTGSESESDAEAHVLRQPDGALTLVAGGDGAPPATVAAVFAAAGRLTTDALAAGGLALLRSRLLDVQAALPPPGRDADDSGECAVVAARVAGGECALLRAGAGAAWLWEARTQRLRPLFTDATTPGGMADATDLDDLLVCALPTEIGLGTARRPTFDEDRVAVQPGDRLLLAATRRLAQLSPELLARALPMRSTDDAGARLAAAAGLGGDARRWPFALVEVAADGEALP